MTTLYVKLIRETATGHEEVFRTTKPDYLPKGWVLVKDLESFTIGGELPMVGSLKSQRKDLPGSGWFAARKRKLH
ncbi:MAG: hypothetical protein PUD16_14305 [bacterium]|nr:hypothetical protein [bacterium]